ncbi:hypothetical protein [Lysinibacillus sp. UBA6686]|uniref:hypothetical protein n=1 Tax=Lysinibacillus sp. UBA6686 TaxID=1946776 RepID=UPI00257D97EA|nr:hypothetical protein [Lysinibacillus sp. UBA6686]
MKERSDPRGKRSGRSKQRSGPRRNRSGRVKQRSGPRKKSLIAVEVMPWFA